MLESGKDLLADLTPIIQQVGLDSIHMMNDLEKKDTSTSYVNQ